MSSTINKPKKQTNFTYVWLAIIAGIMIFGYFNGSHSAAEITKRNFLDTLLLSGSVEKVVVVGETVPTAEVYIKADRIEQYRKDPRWENIPEKGAQFYFGLPDAGKFDEEVKAKLDTSKYPRSVEVKYVDGEGSWQSMLLNFLPLILIVAFTIFIFKRVGSGGGGGGSGGGGVFSVGKAKARLFDKDNDTKVTFKDVAGLEEAKIEVMEVVDFLKKPEKYKELGGKIPKGALLVGPPGTGKTLLAKAVAGEADVPFFSISGSDFVEMFVGVGASRVRDLFRQAKEKAPCIVFIDEIDAIGRARGKNSGFSSNDERENTLNQLLTEMDGFGTNAGVIILAATNRADILDKALLRAGRFDRQINVDLPEVSERQEIFDVHLKKLKLDPSVKSKFFSRQTPGFSGADIANVCNEAALIAARADKKLVEKQDFLDAIDRIIGGLERKSKVFKPIEKKTIAFHEAGHATVSWFLEHANPLLKVTIIPRGKALGAAWYLPDERHISTKEQMMHEMASLLGGRVSEEINFSHVSSGALNDLERTTKQAYAMVAYYGMSDKVGMLSYYDSSGNSEMNFNKPYSEKTAETIDAEVKALINECYEMARKTLLDNKEGLDKLANLLLEKEVIFTEDLENIFGKRPFEVETIATELNDELEKEELEEKEEANNVETSLENTMTQETKTDAPCKNEAECESEDKADDQSEPKTNKTVE